LALPFVGLTGCGQPDASSRNHSFERGQDTVASDATGVILQNDPNEQLVQSVVFSFNQSQSTSLTGEPTWSVELEERTNVTTNVAAQKYLRVTGSLSHSNTSGQAEIGCLQVELKDNVNYREQGWLRIATTGIYGDTYQEVTAPIYIDQQGWKTLPILNDSITLGKFATNTVKAYDGTVCFKVDTKGLPAQSYKGQVVVQYLKTGVPHEEPALDLAQFACGQEPIALNAGKNATISFRFPASIGQLNYTLRSNPLQNAAGLIKESPVKGQVIYTAPTNPAKSFLAIIEAKASQSGYLPVFCEVHVIAPEDFGVGDDGEIQALTGNVYKIPVNSPKIPDYSQLEPLSQVVLANIDIAERDFNTGFPGVKDLVEWFGVQLKGTLRLPSDCQCKFKVLSDDGARFYIDQVLVVDNDGTHAPTSREGSKALASGDHQIRVDYYQGPRYRIALQLFWDLGDGKGYQIIPSEVFSRPMQ